MILFWISISKFSSSFSSSIQVFPEDRGTTRNIQEQRVTTGNKKEFSGNKIIWKKYLNLFFKIFKLDFVLNFNFKIFIFIFIFNFISISCFVNVIVSFPLFPVVTRCLLKLRDLDGKLVFKIFNFIFIFNSSFPRGSGNYT